jgi:hypothetical protein
VPQSGANSPMRPWKPLSNTTRRITLLCTSTSSGSFNCHASAPSKWLNSVGRLTASPCSELKRQRGNPISTAPTQRRVMNSAFSADHAIGAHRLAVPRGS